MDEISIKHTSSHQHLYPQNQHKIHIFTPTPLPTRSTLEFDYMLNTEHVTCNCQCWDELRRHSDKSLLSLRWASADWGRCPRILFVCKSFISSYNFILYSCLDCDICLVNVSLLMIWKWCFLWMMFLKVILSHCGLHQNRQPVGCKQALMELLALRCKAAVVLVCKKRN